MVSQKIMRGADCAQAHLDRMAAELKHLRALQLSLRAPTLCVIQVGDLAASNRYITKKQEAANKLGFGFVHKRLASDVSLGNLLSTVQYACENPTLDGVLIQMPFDAKFLKADEQARALEVLDPDKDADGLTTFNQGLVATGQSHPQNWTSPIPATPLGIMRLLEHNQIELPGKRVTVVGKSRLVGMPVSLLCSQAGATVTLCHRHTVDLPRHTRDAEVLIVAAGSKHLIKKEMLSPGVVIIDVGIHVDPTTQKITGDVDPQALSLASAYTPVPGGVGPMTVAGLLENVARLYIKHTA
jgi:methylenetetrahydrofolate dehydrogenase (NADP+)/methenyltetrahydrofolate cyclohydrolase